jgi:hypothetical protein
LARQPIGAEGVESQELRAARVTTWANGRQSGRQRPIGEVDRTNQNRFASTRQMRLVFPLRRLCVRSVLPSEVFLVALVATDIRERLRGVCPRLLCKDRRRLAQCSAPVRPNFPNLYSVRNIIPNTGPSSRSRTPKQQAATLREKPSVSGANRDGFRRRAPPNSGSPFRRGSTSPSRVFQMPGCAVLDSAKPDAVPAS